MSRRGIVALATERSRPAQLARLARPARPPSLAVTALALAVLASAVLALGCPRRVGTDARAEPDEAVRAYIAAVRAGNAERAYALLGPSARERITKSELASLLESDRDEMLLHASEIEARLAAGMSVRADVPLGTGGTVRLVRERDGWRMDEGALSEAPPSTPEACLRALVRALEGDRLEPALVLLSARLRAEFDTELGLVLEALRTAAAAGIEPAGDSARVMLDRERALVLVRESEVWRVDRIEGVRAALHPAPPAPK